MLPPPPPRPPPRTAAFFLSSASSFTPRPPPLPPSNLLLLVFSAAAALSFLSLLKTPSFPCLRLRRRRPPAMRPPPLAFPSPESLSEWLGRRLPPSALDSWGHAPGSKPLLNLWLELSHGDSSLLLPPDGSDDGASPVRAVRVAAVRIRCPRGRLLVESRQLLSDGTVRSRGRRPLSEKMRPGESVADAVARAVREELGKDEVRIVPGTEETRVEERESASYPGLPGRYVLHSVEAEVGGLPEEGEFETDEAGEEDEARADAVFVKKHYWEWVDDDGGAPRS